MPFCLEFRRVRSEEHTSELQSHDNLVCRLLLEKKKQVGKADAGAFWRVMGEYGVEPLFTAPTAMRAIKKEDPDATLLRFFNDTATTEIYTLSLHDALPI